MREPGVETGRGRPLDAAPGVHQDARRRCCVVHNDRALAIFFACSFGRDVALFYYKYVCTLVVSSMGQYIAPIAEEDEWRCVEGTVMRRPGSLSSREHVLSARPTHLWSLFGGALQCAFGLCSRPERTTFNAMYGLACRRDTGVCVTFRPRSGEFQRSSLMPLTCNSSCVYDGM